MPSFAAIRLLSGGLLVACSVTPTTTLYAHPNVARVLDAGKAPSGRPYFVMELVKGQPITGHGGTVVSLAISPDGTAITSCSLDQTVRVWRAATQAEVKQNPGSVEEIRRRLETQIRARNWKQAAAELSEALDSLAAGTEQWHYVAFELAFVLAYAGETEKYQALCQSTVRDFQQTTNMLIASRTALMCFFAGIAHQPDVTDKAGRLAEVVLANVEGAIARKERPGYSLDRA
jgi:hypothetical protein